MFAANGLRAASTAFLTAFSSGFFLGDVFFDGLSAALPAFFLSPSFLALSLSAGFFFSMAF